MLVSLTVIQRKKVCVKDKNSSAFNRAHVLKLASEKQDMTRNNLVLFMSLELQAS